MPTRLWFLGFLLPVACAYEAPPASPTPAPVEVAKANPPQADPAPPAPYQVAEPAKLSPPSPVEQEGAKMFARASNELAADLYEILRRDQKGNIAFSPLSISTALTMTYAGAAGMTEASMGKALHVDGTRESFIAGAGYSLRATNDAARTLFKLRAINGAFVEQSIRLDPAFVEVTKTAFGAEIAEADFAHKADEHRALINDWVARATDDKIGELLPEGVLDETTRLVLVNAVYLDANWQRPFPSNDTKDSGFFIDGVAPAKPVPTMLMTARNVGYASIGQVDLVELPYMGDELAMVIALPKERDLLDEVEKELTADLLKEWFEALKRADVEVHLPRFEIGLTASTPLRAPLRELGFDIFGEPDFSRMGAGRVAVSDVHHQAMVRVHEAGTEAAAATGSSMVLISKRPDPEVFRAEHPFLFFIRDRKTNLILFWGRVVRPNEKS